MLNKKPAIFTGIFISVFLVLMLITQMGAGYVIPEAGFDGSALKYNQYGKSFAHSPGQFDRNCDGRIDLIVADRNGDGVADYWATDRNYDGKFDDYQYDRNFDGKIDQWEYDLDLDGISDKIYVDSDGDGKAELYAILNPVTRTYTWYGNMNTVRATVRGYEQPEPITGKIYRQAKGKKGDSF